MNEGAHFKSTEGSLTRKTGKEESVKGKDSDGWAPALDSSDSFDSFVRVSKCKSGYR
jgi:hypothetical protein